eukprot:768053-Hanusia_phi.AAC.1
MLGDDKETPTWGFKDMMKAGKEDPVPQEKLDRLCLLCESLSEDGQLESVPICQGDFFLVSPSSVPHSTAAPSPFQPLPLSLPLLTAASGLSCDTGAWQDSIDHHPYDEHELQVQLTSSLPPRTLPAIFLVHLPPSLSLPSCAARSLTSAQVALHPPTKELRKLGVLDRAQHPEAYKEYPEEKIRARWKRREEEKEARKLAE